MKTRRWMNLKTDKGKLPPENTGVHFIEVNTEKNAFSIYTGHVENGVWFIYDAFSQSFKIFPRQTAIYYWCQLNELPTKLKAGKKK